jgi:peptidoglycan/xylan/chitin deacetylase (PgdA/CDA1 family)
VKKGSESPLETGVFTLSLDFELIWGTLDLFGPERFRGACERERELIDRLLELFVEFEIAATWCVLGHLFLERCEAVGGCKHGDIVRPRHGWHPEDWFRHDPGTDEATDPVFYGRSLIDKLLGCAVPQEIGCHSFSHVIFGDGGCSRATAESEIRRCVELAAERGVVLRSFAFPRNRVGHLDVLRGHGFVCYRGPDDVWYERGGAQGVVRRLAHLVDVVLARRPAVVVPVRSAEGLWNIPGSMIYFPMHGFRRWIPLGWRVKRAVKGLEAAVREKKVFHLWFHPTNLADRPEEMFLGLRQIFEQVRELREKGVLAVVPMKALVPAEAEVQ